MFLAKYPKSFVAAEACLIILQLHNPVRWFKLSSSSTQQSVSSTVAMLLCWQETQYYRKFEKDA